VALILGLLAAVLFTVFMVGVALLFVLPTVFLTTFAASFIFIWGLGGYYILKWFNEGDTPAEPGTAIGDKINNLTGGRLSFLMDGARKKEEGKNSIVQDGPLSGKDGPAPGVEDVKKNVDKVTDGVQKKAGGVPQKLTSTAGGAKGAVGGATGAA
jgi:hypothetical protein